MLQDPELRQFVETPELMAWMGPRRHLIATHSECYLLFPERQEVLGA